MNVRELKEITKSFEDVKQIISKRKQLAKDILKIRRKLKTKFSEYDFLLTMLGAGVGTPLVNAIVKYFKTIGFINVKNVDKYDKKEEDIVIEFDNYYIMIEVSACENSLPTEDKAHQISKHINIRKNEQVGKTVIAFFILNHHYSNHYLKRTKKPFTERLKQIASSNEYGLITTVDLFSLLKEHKQKKLTNLEVIEKMKLYNK